MGAPSIKVAAIAVISLAGVAGLMYYTYSEHQRYVPNTKSLEAFIGAASKSLAELDTDSDGLKDWEESLWNTDPEIADSDGDGTNDGDEAENSRNPAKKGEDTLASGKDLVVPDYFKTSTSTTDAAGKALFAKYLALKQSGKFSAVTQQGLVEELTASILSTSQINGSYKKTDLTLVPNSTENASIYKVNMEAVSTFITESGLKGSELMAIALAMSGNPEDIEKGVQALEPFIIVHEKALAKFETMPIPEGIADAHVNFLNTYIAFVETLRMLRNAAQDPIRAMVASSTYLQREHSMQRAYLVLKTYMQSVPR